MIDRLRRAAHLHRFQALVLVGLLLLAPALSAASDIVKSPNDDRDYRLLRLDNGLEALLISDPATDTAAAALNVGVGSAQDPKDRAGLAHFLEHMLFLGTEKYPNPGEYQAFIRSHGGRHNAYTAFDATNYFFSVEASHLEPALDRFSQFFVAPLFTPAYVEREINAVHSEYQMKLSSEFWRTAAAQKQLMNPEHPNSRFSIGSLQTLADRSDDLVREDLLTFYHKYYSAGHMSLVVLGRESLVQLEDWAEDKFSAVPTHPVVETKVREPLFAPGTLPHRLDVVPLKDQKRLELTFPVPSSEQHYRSKPLVYLADLLGHEGEGSLLSALKAKGWVDGLSASGGQNLGRETTFELDMRLTEAGVKAVDQIIAEVFAQLALIEGRGIDEWRFDEHRKLGSIDFRFAEKGDPMYYATSLARVLRRYPPQDLLRAGYLWEEFDPDLIRAYLSQMTPDNVLVTLTAPGLATDRVTPYFGTRYAASPITDGSLQSWQHAVADSELALPAPNPFVPERLEVKPLDQESTIPERIVAEPGFDLWWLQDRTFRVPRADFKVAVDAPAVRTDARSRALLQLYTRVVAEAMNEYAYPARLAGLGFAIDATLSGFALEISGYSGKQGLLLERLLETVQDPQVSAERFDDIKANLMRHLSNSSRDDPSDQAFSELSNLLISPYWSDPEVLAALRPLDYDDLRDFIPTLLARLDTTALAHGNLVAGEARKLGKQVTAALVRGAEVVTVPEPRVIKLAAGSGTPVREIAVTQSDSALTFYIQGHDASLADRATMGLLAQVVAAPFYEELRTERQLGYLVFASPMPLIEVPGMVLAVQSPVAGPSRLIQEIEGFLDSYLGPVGELSDAEVDRHKAALASKLLERPQSLSEKTSDLWRDLNYRRYRFDTRERIAEEVRRLGADDLTAAYRKLLLGDQRQALAVAARGTGADGDDRFGALIEDVRSFKSRRPVVAVPDGMREAAAELSEITARDS